MDIFNKEISIKNPLLKLNKLKEKEKQIEEAKKVKKEKVEKFTAREKEFLYKKKLRSKADLLVEK